MAPSCPRRLAPSRVLAPPHGARERGSGDGRRGHGPGGQAHHPLLRLTSSPVPGLTMSHKLAVNTASRADDGRSCAAWVPRQTWLLRESAVVSLDGLGRQRKCLRNRMRSRLHLILQLLLGVMVEVWTEDSMPLADSKSRPPGRSASSSPVLRPLAPASGPSLTCRVLWHNETRPPGAAPAGRAHRGRTDGI